MMKEKIATAAVGVGLFASACAPENRAIDATHALDKYRHLPAPVAHAALSAVKVEAPTEEIIKVNSHGRPVERWFKEVALGTGAIIQADGTKTIAVSAHNVSVAPARCADTMIEYPGAPNNHDHALHVMRQSHVDQFNPALHPNYDPNYNGGRDFAELKPKEQGAPLPPALLPLKNPNRKIHPGKTVVFNLSEQRYASGKARTPSTPPYDKPQITAGVVVDKEGNNLIEATGVKDYNSNDKAPVMHGSSGSAVVTAHGDYLGLLSTIKTPMSREDISAYYGVKLPEAKRGYIIATVRLVSKALAATVHAEAVSGKNCRHVPVKKVH